MKKKFPVMPVVGICLAVGLVAVFNMTGGNLDFSKYLSKKAEEAKEAEVSQATSDANKAALAAGTKALKPMADPNGVVDGNPPQPTIFIPKVSRNKETINESMTYGHWDDENSAVKQKGDEVRKGRSLENN